MKSLHHFRLKRVIVINNLPQLWQQDISSCLLFKELEGYLWIKTAIVFIPGDLYKDRMEAF